jgi:hypothetical protein
LKTKIFLSSMKNSLIYYNTNVVCNCKFRRRRIDNCYKNYQKILRYSFTIQIRKKWRDFCRQSRAAENRGVDIKAILFNEQYIQTIKVLVLLFPQLVNDMYVWYKKCRNQHSCCLNVGLVFAK